MSIRIEFADEPVSIVLGECRELSDKGFNQVTAGLFQGLCTAETNGVCFHERWIEVVLADQQAELVAETSLTVLVAAIPIRGRRVLIGSVSARSSRRPPKFFNRA